DDDHVVFLHLFLWNDVVRCSVWSNRVHCLRHTRMEVSEDVRQHEEIIEAVLLLWAFYISVGHSFRRIFRKYRGYCIREVLWDGGHSSSALVHSAELPHEAAGVLPSFRRDPPVCGSWNQRIPVLKRRQGHGLFL